MELNIKNIIMSMSMMAVLTGLQGCTDNDYMELNTGEEPLVLSVSADAVTLTEKAHASEALALSWTTGTNQGTGGRITYALSLRQEDAASDDSFFILQDAVQKYDWKPSNQDLNKILLEQFHAVPGIPLIIDATVTATVAGLEGDPQISSVKFTATPYKPVSETLYLIGDATPNGWNADNATEMARLENGIFSWTGNLVAGEFKFITEKGSFLPSYGSNGQGGLVYRDADDQPDLKFEITEPHTYKVDVNLLNLSVSVTPVEGITPPYDTIFFVGDVTGWDFLLMQQDPLDPFLFRYGIFFQSAGEFKFGTSQGSWENMYKATSEKAPYTSQGVEFVKGYDPDNKWYLNDSETNMAYKVCLDIRPGKERMIMRPFTPYTEMYLVGSATPGGWDLGSGTPMTVDPSNPDVFTWTGRLTEGEMKISADLQSDWNGAWFMAASANAAPTGTIEKTIFIDKSDNGLAEQYPDIAIGDVDLKWVISEPGTYTITLNQLLEEITITKD